MTILNSQTIEQLRGLELRAKVVVDGAYSGAHRSAGRGFSVEFAEHREYSAGDDLRYVDWKVFARRDRVYVKQFETETDFQCHLVLDVSESMTYRGPKSVLSKWGYAQLLSAAIAAVVTHQQDRATVTTITDRIVGRARATGQLGDLIAFLESTAPLTPSAPGATEEPVLGQSLNELAELIRRRGLVLVFSDCLTDSESLLLGLRHLQFQGHDVTLFHVVDAAEEEFPFDEPLQLQGLEALGEQKVDARWLASAYREEFREFREALEQGCRDHRIDYRLTRTDIEPERLLRDFLTARMGQR
jgi:uncharacterized protein (DUF58 family)